MSSCEKTSSSLGDTTTSSSDEQFLPPVHRSTGMAPSSSVAKLQQRESLKKSKRSKPAKSVALKKSSASAEKNFGGSENQNQDSKDGRGKKDAASSKSDSAKTPLTSKKQTQSNLTSFFKGKVSPKLLDIRVRVASPVSPNVRREVELSKVRYAVSVISKALVSQNTKSFYTHCGGAAKVLSQKLIDEIPNEIIRFAVLREAQKIRDTSFMMKMSVEERAAFRMKRKEERGPKYFAMEKELDRLLHKKLDDTLILDSMPLPELKSVGVGEGETTAMFTCCLSITEFLVSFRALLCPDLLPSAQELLSALRGGFDGYRKITAHVVVALLKVHLQDSKAKKYSVYDVNLHSLPVTVGTASELARLIFIENNTSGSEASGSSLQCEDDAQSLTLAVRLTRRCCEIYELSSKDQVEVLEMLFGFVLGSSAVEQFIGEGLRKRIADTKELLQAEHLKVEELTAEMATLPVVKPLEELNRLERMRQKGFEKRHAELKESIEKSSAMEATLKDKIAELEATLLRVVRVEPIGLDRDNKRYWFFKGSPNTGIYVEQGWFRTELCEPLREMTVKHGETGPGNAPNGIPRSSAGVPCPSSPVKGRKSLSLDAFINSEIVYAKDTEDARWLHIGDVETLTALCGSLSKKGARESALLNSLTLLMDDITRSFHAPSILRNEEGEKEEPEEVEEENDSEWSNLGEEMAGFAKQLWASFFTNIKNKNLLVSRIMAASTVPRFKTLLLELFDSIFDRAFKKGSKRCEAGSRAFSGDRWKAFVRNSSSLSQLNVLLSILEMSIDWKRKKCASCRRSTNAKMLVECSDCGVVIHAFCVRPVLTRVPSSGTFVCSTCRQKNDESEEENERARGSDFESDRESESDGGGNTRGAVLANGENDQSGPAEFAIARSRSPFDGNRHNVRLTELEELFSKIERDHRTFSALENVPPVRARGTRRFITLGSIKQNLHSYRSKKEFMQDLQCVFKAATEFFQGNTRKLSFLSELETELGF